MPFSLTNAPADFQHMINNTLYPLLDHFYTTYLDHILTYSATLEEHQEHVWKVLEALSRAGLQWKPEKYYFNKTKVKYLGLILSANSDWIDLEKITAILE